MVLNLTSSALKINSFAAAVTVKAFDASRIHSGVGTGEIVSAVADCSSDSENVVKPIVATLCQTNCSDGAPI